MRAICISGLGANEKAFSNIGDITLPKVFVKWKRNLNSESLTNYAVRLIREYDITVDDVLIGLSFGGLLSQKIAEINGNRVVILISSFRSLKDLNNLFQLGLKSKMYKLLPTVKIPIVDSMVTYMLNSGTKSSRPILKEMLYETDYKLMKWSIDKIASFKEISNHNFIMYNVIGEKDVIVRCWENKNTFKIGNGSHFMIFEQGDQITNILRKIIVSENEIIN